MAQRRAKTPEQKQKFLNRLQKIWEAHPNLRFGQLVDNIKLVPQDLYYVEDEELLNQAEHQYQL